MGRTVNGIEIPEEFDGIDDDIALGLMKDNGLIEDEQKEPEKTEVTTDKVESTDGDDAKKNPDVKEIDPPTTGQAAPVKEQEQGEGTTDDLKDDATGKTVPYQAMIAERKKRKELQAEIAQLKAQYNNNPVQVQQPVTQPPVVEQKVEQTAEQQQAYDDYIEKSAVEMFIEKYKREPDELSRTDNIILGRYAAKVEDGIQEYQEQQKKIANEAQKNNQSYRQFAADQKARDEYEEIEIAFVEEIKALPPDEQDDFKKALQQCESGTGTRQDVLLVKKFWNDAAKKVVSQNVPSTEIKETTKVVTPQKPAKTDEEKLEQIEKHPKVNLVTGNNASASTSIDEIARLMNDMPWPEFEKKHPEFAKLVLEG